MLVLCLELLEANDVGLRPCEPRREIMQTLLMLLMLKVATSMVRPHAKRPFCPDPSVTLQVLRLRGTRFEDEVRVAVECILIEPQPHSPARWDQ